GLGGFTLDGREYRVRVTQTQLPPQPWINVVANPNFGFLISESGAGFTWRGNSQSNRLTPWSNDPVGDPLAEVIYIRDEHAGDAWSATPRPLGGDAEYVVRHGQGFTVFDHQRAEINQSLTVFTPPEEPVKIYQLRLHNSGRRSRRLTVLFFAEWVLGTTRDRTAPHLITQEDRETGALFATNAFHADEPAQIAFADINLRPRTLTADRREFLGRHGSVRRPAALSLGRLSGKAGPALDACAALAATVVIAPAQSVDVVIV